MKPDYICVQESQTFSCNKNNCFLHASRSALVFNKWPPLLFFFFFSPFRFVISNTLKTVVAGPRFVARLNPLGTLAEVSLDCLDLWRHRRWEWRALTAPWLLHAAALKRAMEQYVDTENPILEEKVEKKRPVTAHKRN